MSQMNSQERQGLSLNASPGEGMLYLSTERLRETEKISRAWRGGAEGLGQLGAWKSLNIRIDRRLAQRQLSPHFAKKAVVRR